MPEISENRALKDFNTFWEATKCVVSRALPWVVGTSLVLGFLPGVIGLSLGGIGSALHLTSAASTALSFASSGLTTGAMVGGFLGVSSGLWNLSDDLQDARDEHIFRARASAAEHDRMKAEHAIARRSQRLQPSVAVAKEDGETPTPPSLGSGKGQYRSV